jgi:replicative DNA helicase
LKKKKVSDLAPKYQKIVKEMNLLKGNINFTNEIIDNCTCKADAKNNETLIDLLKALKEMEPKLFELIQSVEEEDIMAICLLVNEDM